MQLNINGQTAPLPALWQEESLLTVLREALGLVGAKFGCGVGLCGACTVLIDGAAQRACLLPVRLVAQGQRITTIEGLATPAGMHPVQQAWVDERVPQCGYCQAGQVMGTVALLRQVPQPSDAQIDQALAGHLCRCGTQQRIRAAIRRASHQKAAAA